MIPCIQRLLRLRTFLAKAPEGVLQNLSMHWGIPDVKKEIEKLGNDFLRAQGQEVTIVTFS